MRVTVCELPHESPALDDAWARLCAHTREQRSDVIVLPEFAFVEPVWMRDAFDRDHWDTQVAACDAWLGRLPELGAAHVIGTRPVTRHGLPFNEGFRWSTDGGYQALRSKRHLPNEPGGWEARWFTRSDDDFATFDAGPLRFGLNICTELWALETYGSYANAPLHAIISPRATATATLEKWLAVGNVAAVRAGAFGISSNRVHRDGSCGGVGWIIDPDGQTLALTSADSPSATVDIDLAAAEKARATYPRYVFADG